MMLRNDDRFRLAPNGPAMTARETARSIVDEMADALGMPRQPAARHHSRMAVLGYAEAYRRAHEMVASQTAELIAGAWQHLERAVEAGASRERLENHFARIRARYAGAGSLGVRP